MSKLAFAVITGVSMSAYIGTKLVNAKPMTRQEYNDFRGWTLPIDENGGDAGYLVEYVDGGKANTAEYSGYVSWSPADVFARSYKASGSLSFSEALIALKASHRVARTGWNGKDQYVVAQAQTTSTDASKIWNPHNKAHAEKLGGSIDVAPYCTLKTAQDTLAMGWTPSTGDLFASDWVILD